MSQIVIVEDDAQVAAFLEEALNNSGFSILHAATGAMGRALGLSQQVDLVILDMGLPDGDGLDVIRAIRDAGLATPILVLTGLAERDVVTCLEAGADDYMRKPFEFEELLARVRTRIRDRNGTSARLSVAR